MSQKLGKKGQLGMDVAKGFVLAILTLAVIAFAVIIALDSLQNTSVSTGQTGAIVNNVTVGVATFFSNATTWFTLLAVVVIILIISVVIFAVNRFGGSAGGGL